MLTDEKVGEECLTMMGEAIFSSDSWEKSSIKIVPKVQNCLPATRVRGAAKASACICQGPCGAPAGVVLSMVANW